MPPSKLCPGCDSVRVAEKHPHIHSHLLIPCDELVERGHTAEELCCHGCHEAETIVFPMNPVKIPLKPYLDRYSQRIARFWRKHAKCKVGPMFWTRSECSKERSNIRIYDMRKMSMVPPRKWKKL
jgi:hypothetical protein